MGRFILRKCKGSPRYIFISGSLATALPRLSYLMQSALASKQKNMGHPIILGFILCFESNTYCDFMNVVPIHELVKATAMQGFMSLVFHTQADTEIKATLDKTNSSVTCRVHCKHPISLTTGRETSIPTHTHTKTPKIASHCVGIMDGVSEEENMLQASKFINTLSCEGSSETLSLLFFLHFLETFG